MTGMRRMEDIKSGGGEGRLVVREREREENKRERIDSGVRLVLEAVVRLLWWM